ncbi:MAG: Asp-tRNA(Asn)/Glu-tRNA(Gln) amidotransferase subunit GatC [Acidobacteriota bacterium]
MKIDESKVEYVANLAHLAITGDEKKKFIGQLNSILEYVEQLNALETDGVEPTAQVVHTTEQNYSLRPDEPHVTFSQEDSLKNSPASGSGHFKVPKVIADR